MGRNGGDPRDHGNTSTNGGTTAFSTATDTAHLTVTGVNDAPVATITPASYCDTEQVALNLKSNGLSITDAEPAPAR